uniref:Uncharacterized protein n=1 Tax=Caudovirales sp. ctSH72 TaxID=2826773 RepID=A0A8S5QP03_9CAUD|nr:MAG TPA: hypothetical protein [Caudovirales sp. ctSH72]
MATFDDIIKGSLIDMLSNYDTCHLCYSWDLANIVASEILERKPWWWLINICYDYYPEIKDTLRRYHIPLKGDTTDWARLAITIEVAELLATSDAVIDTWKTYDTKKGELPAMLDRTVARHISIDLVFED